MEERATRTWYACGMLNSKIRMRAITPLSFFIVSFKMCDFHIFSIQLIRKNFEILRLKD